ncbi:MAG: hypothetical protein AAGU11_11335 [Syntrophobacteraceae bacterium]
MARKILMIIFAAVLVFGAVVESAHALVTGPMGPNGFPLWIGDGVSRAEPGTRVKLCLAVDPADPEGAPCFPTPRFPTPVPPGPEAEAVYYAADIITGAIPGITDFRLIAAIEAVNSPVGDPAEGIPPGKIIFNSILLRVDPAPASGDVTAVTPWGTFTVPGAAVAGERLVVDLGPVGIGLPTDRPPFSGATTGAVQTFHKALSTAALPNLVGFASEGHEIPQGLATGGDFAVNIGGVDIPLPPPGAAVLGQLLSEPGTTAAYTVTGPPARPRRSLVVNCPAGATQVQGTFLGRRVRGQPVPVVGGVATIPLPNITIARRLPEQVACTDGLVPPVDSTVTTITDSITGSARVNARGQLVVRATSSFQDLGRPVTLTLFHGDRVPPRNIGPITGGIKIFPATRFPVFPTNIIVRSSGGAEAILTVRNIPAPPAAP